VRGRPISSVDEAAHDAGVRASLEAYYTRYYRETLGIPRWPDHVANRLADQPREKRRLARLEAATGRSARGLRLLNVGCGPGGFNLVASAAGARAVGIDAFDEAVAIAARRGADVLTAEAERLPFRSGAFDLVYCYSTLEHVAGAAAAVSEMLRVLAPDGALYLHLPHRWACSEGHYKIFWVPGLPRWAGRLYLRARGRPPAFLDTLRPLSLGSVRRLVARSGGRIVTVMDGAPRRTGGPLWPLVRAYYRLFGIRSDIEVVAVRPPGG